MRSIVFITALISLAMVTACDDDGVRVGGVRPAECADVRPFSDSCDGLSRFVRTAGLLDTDGAALGVFARSGRVYIADGDNGLLVVDACDPALMTVLGRAPTPGSAMDVSVAGRYAYVACGRAGLAVVDVGDPMAPTVVGTVRGAGTALDVDVAGTHAYVADDAIGLMIYDVADPGDPVLRGAENTPGQARGVRVVGPVAYVADAVLGLRIVSVQDPASPWLVKSVRTPGDATDVDVVDGLAYVADGTAGLTIIDVSSIPDAAVRSRVDTADRALDVRVDGGVALVIDRDTGLLLYDVTLPDAPVLVAGHGGAGAGAVALSRDYAYVADGAGGLRVVDVRTSEPPPVLSEISPAGSQATTVITDGAMVYVGDAGFGLYVDEWTGGALSPRGSLALPDGANNALLYDGFLYVSGADNGVYIVDVGDPDRPVVVGMIPGTSNSIDIAIADSVCFTARGAQSPTVYSLRTQANPQAVSIVAVLRGVEVGRTFAYFLSVQGTLYVTTLTPPVALVWSIVTGRHPSDLVVRNDGAGNDVLCVALEADADGNPGVEVYSLADPRIPQLALRIDTSIPALRIAFAGDYLYVAGQGDGLEVFDIRDPMSPVPVGSYWRTQPIHSAAAVSGATLVAAGTAGLLALPAPCTTP
jgi:hypothetical protein